MLMQVPRCCTYGYYLKEKCPYTHKEVAAHLGVTDMTAVKARQKLEAFGCNCL